MSSRKDVSAGELRHRAGLTVCCACACIVALWALDAVAMSCLTAPKQTESSATAPTGGEQAGPAEPEDDTQAEDPIPVIPPGAEVADELVGLHLDGWLYVPLRASLSLIGGEPLDGAPGGHVRTISGVGLVEFDIGSAQCSFNGRSVALRAPITVRAGTTYLTARDFAELFEVPMATENGGRRAIFTVRERQVVARPESDLYEIEINRSARRLTLHFRGDEVGSYPVCVGRSRATPVGEFRVAIKVVWPAWRSIYTGALVPGGRGNPLGARWLGLTARGAEGHVIGVHGTNTPRSIGRAVSAGCIRMHNKDVIAVFEKVSVGTPVRIHD